MTTTTILQVGTYNALTDTFTLVLDLNDRATFYLDELDLPTPPKADVRAFNVRTPGEVVVREQYKNRQITATLWIKGASTTALLASVRSFIAAVATPRAAPYVLRFQLPNGTLYSYADVVACTHTLPNNAKEILAGAIGGKKRVHVMFECSPGLRGDRVVLTNAVSNPGFEAPSGPQMGAFIDGFGTTAAYTVVTGSAPSVSSNVMSIPSGTTLQFGSPAWGAYNFWQVRFQWNSGITEADFYLHRTDANNFLYTWINGTSLNLAHVVGNTYHGLASASLTLTNGNWYWLTMTQFPAVAGMAPYLTATLYNDSSGTFGTQVAQVGADAYDGVTSLVGRPGFHAAGAALQVGGNYTNVHLLALFGPGGWYTINFTGTGAYAWEGSRGELGMVGTTVPGTATYGGGPVTSFGSARIDFPSSGAFSGAWTSYLVGGGVPGSGLIPVSQAGNTVRAACYTTSSNLGSSASIALIVQEFSSNGTYLRQTAVQTVTGNQASWVNLSGSVTTGANCAYVGLLLNPVDTTTGSVNATVWFDNVQCWDQTRTGMTSMPYCELRFPQTPANVLLSGVLGDMPSPTSTWIGFNSVDTPNGYNFPGLAFIATRLAPTAGFAGTAIQAALAQRGITTAVLDSTSYGGYYLKLGWSHNNLFGNLLVGGGISMPLGQLTGTYHLYARIRTLDPAPTAVQLQANFTYTFGSPFAAASTVGYTVNLTTVSPFTDTNWTIVDLGKLTLPASPLPVQADTSSLYLQIDIQAQNGTNALEEYDLNWIALYPVDDNSCLVNWSKAAGALSMSPPAVNGGYIIDGTSPPLTATVAVDSLTVAVPTYNQFINFPGGVLQPLLSTMDPYLLVNPAPLVGGVVVNQAVLMLTTSHDSPANVPPGYPHGGYVETTYSPRYLFPR